MSFLGCSSTVLLLCLSGVSSWSLQEFSVSVLITTSKRIRCSECVVHAFRGLSHSVMIPCSRLHVNIPKASVRRPAGSSLSAWKSAVWVFNLISFQARARACDGWFPRAEFMEAVERGSLSPFKWMQTTVYHYEVIDWKILNLLC